MATQPTPNTALNAIPGETAQQYETRLGMTSGGGIGTGFGTPNPGFATENKDANGNVLAPPDFSSPQGQAIKKALEDAANSSGSALGGVPTRGSATTNTPIGSTMDNFDLSAVIKGLGSAPIAPDMSKVQSDAESAAGIPDIQNNITTLTDQYTNLQNELQNSQAQEASKPGVVASIVNGRMKMLSAEQSKALNDLKANISSEHTRLTNANSAVAKIMANTKSDYQTASTNYNQAYTRAISLFNAQESKMSRDQTRASANAKVIIDSYKGTSNSSKITDNDRAQWTNLETQAGLPSGFIEAAIKAESTSGVKVDHWTTDAQGNTYAYGTDASGKPVILETFNSTGKPSSSKNQNTPGANGLTPDEQKKVDSFNKSLANSTALMRTSNPITREQFIRQLQAEYPDINPDQISQAVYKTYPDNYNK